MNGVPIVDFSRTYSDSELYDMIELTIEEREAIDSSLPDYYGRNYIINHMRNRYEV
jgi:hypothetical protein